MRELILIYNPVAGKRRFLNYLDKFIQRFQSEGYNISLYRTTADGDLSSIFKIIAAKSYDVLVVAGGDGSINEVVNGIMKYKIDVPLGVIPAGTANDFASHLNIPLDIEESFNVISRSKLEKVDVGEVDGRYFINVCAGGLLANVAHDIDLTLKNTLGKLGYYLKGVKELPNFKPIPARITTRSKVIEEYIYLFLILNGSSAGGFNRLAPKASIKDGYFDLIGIKALPLHELPKLFIKIVQGEHLNDHNVIYLRDSYFKIEMTGKEEIIGSSDIDGEVGPALPLEIKLHQGVLKVFSNL
ncbi:YegS/Rv2252/BmrU family lipid kinase [Halonatronum saccharophilum]|uniref:YegS/Rv2252/BmrU family lipid kinase n=1 Tax=Halonatronum saccharophilum TaxID=150060 RepID=UPI000487C6FD|nr:YegS/Rv2252/BmrU family lipid kinase [Halonatronum saccharophilum]